jgi:hypothetical protein
MLKIIQKTLIVTVLISTALAVFADGGVRKKNKNNISLNINTYSSTLRNSIPFNLRTGLVYKGSLRTTNLFSKTPAVNNSIISFQKGNTVYVIPYKQKILVPEIQQGYTGMKLIIKPH